MKHMTNQEARQMMTKTEEIEAEKMAKQAERLEKQAEKERQIRQAFLEKLVAPVLLFLTIVISLILLSVY